MSKTGLQLTKWL